MENLMENQKVENLITGGMTIPNATVATAYYSPEPGSKYHLIWGHTPDIHDIDGMFRFTCTWMHGAGGVTIMHSIGDYCHYTYVSEKMEIGDEDAKAIAHFINLMNCVDYKPEEFSHHEMLPRGVRQAYELNAEVKKMDEGNSIKGIEKQMEEALEEALSDAN